MSKPLAMNMYVQNAAGIFVPLLWPAYTADGVAYANIPEVGIAINSGSAVNRVLSPAGQGDANNMGSSLPIAPWQYIGGGNWDRQRTPNIFKLATATASGNTALWTPTSGKKFRLMGFIINVTANVVAASAGILAVTFQDSASAMNIGYSAFIPAAAGTTFANDASSSWIVLGNGFPSAAANNVLNINLSFALTGGQVQVMGIGTEE